MLYIFSGNDRIRALTQARSFISDMQKKRPDADSIRVTALHEVDIQELFMTQGLFDEKRIAFFDEIGEDKWAPFFSDLQNSPHLFIIFEEELSDAVSKQASEEATLNEYKSEKKEVSVSPFPILKLLVAGNIESFWVAYNKHIEDNAVEGFLPVLEWQVRALLAPMLVSSQKESGLKPFSYESAKKTPLKYEPLLTFYRELQSALYQKTPLSINIERALLRLGSDSK